MAAETNKIECTQNESGTFDQGHQRRSFEKINNVDYFLATLTKKIREKTFKNNSGGERRQGTINKINTKNVGMLGIA